MALPDDRRHTLADHTKDAVGQKVVCEASNAAGEATGRTIDVGGIIQKGGPPIDSSLPLFSWARVLIELCDAVRAAFPSTLLHTVLFVVASAHDGQDEEVRPAGLTVRTFVRTFPGSYAKRRIA
jgi:hypothetical protein